MGVAFWERADRPRQKILDLAATGQLKIRYSSLPEAIIAVGGFMDFSTLLAFAAAFFVFAASPGPDNMTIVARTISNGAASGIAYGAGTVVGILIFLTLAAFGLSILAAEMGVVMTILRYAGAAYLIWMGIKLWTAEPVVPELQPVNGRGGLLSVFATGIALNLGNPKMPLFYIALLPNMVGASLTLGHVGVLAAVILAVEVVVIGGHVILASRARKLLRSPRIVRRVNRTAGGVMVGAGMTVVAAR
jgi:threonine/homoserine/homoserine lactone efflux protein